MKITFSTSYCIIFLVLGSYECDCDLGFAFTNGTCLDINECEEETDPCLHGTCENLEPGLIQNQISYLVFVDSRNYTSFFSLLIRLRVGFEPRSSIVHSTMFQVLQKNTFEVSTQSFLIF